jgi:hypothetical protein
MARFNDHIEYRGKTLNGAINKVGRYMANTATCDAIDDCKSREAWKVIKAALRKLRVPTEQGNTGPKLIATRKTPDSPQLPLDIKKKFSNFVASQKDIPPEFAQVVNDDFWNLIK